MIHFRAMCKQLFGAKYEQLIKSLFSCIILFLSLYCSGFRVRVAPFIFYLTATVFTSGIMWQTLHAALHDEKLHGLFMLPVTDSSFVISYVASYTSHTLITKTFPVLALLLSVQLFSPFIITIAFLSALNACIATAACFSLLRHSYAAPWHRLVVLPWGASILGSIWWFGTSMITVGILLASLLLGIVFLFHTDAYIYHDTSDDRTFHKIKENQYGTDSTPSAITARGITKHNPSPNGAIYRYLLRYLMAHKNYLINTVFMWAAACYLPFLFRSFVGLNVWILPIGFAVLCLNTPLCILLSCDRDFELAIRSLPGQGRRFLLRYCVFLSCSHIIVSILYLCSWQIQYGGIRPFHLLVAMCFALQSALLSVLLEWFYPIHGYKIESDLWHHPRKYVVPGFMILLAALIAIFPFMVWIWIILLPLQYMILTTADCFC